MNFPQKIWGRHKPRSTPRISVRTILRVGLCALCVCLPSSCSFVNPAITTSPEPPVSVGGPSVQSFQKSKDAIVTDIYRVRIRAEHRELLQALWDDGSTSEQILPFEKRRQLNREGIRVGLQGISMSPSLSRLLELDVIRHVESSGTLFDRASAELRQNTESPVHERQFTAEELVREKLVNWIPFTFLPGKRCILNTYDERLPEIVMFSRDGSDVSGKTYHDVQGVLEMSAIPYPDGSGVQFDLLPRLEYGQARKQLGLSHASASQTTGKRETVDLQHDLKISLKLLPGQWLLLGATEERPAGAGRYFFTRHDGQVEQKLIVIRLADVRRNDSAEVPQAEKILQWNHTDTE